MMKIIALALAMSFATPVLAQDFYEDGPVQYRSWDGGPGWDRPRWQQRRHWRMRQARRDCYRYGDCRRWGMMQQRRDWYGRDWRRHHRRNGFTLQFGF